MHKNNLLRFAESKQESKKRGMGRKHDQNVVVPEIFEERYPDLEDLVACRCDE